MKFKEIIKISLNKFAKQNNSSFGHIEYIKINRMNECSYNNACQYVLNDTSVHITKIFNKCKKAINESLDEWKGVQKSKKNTSIFRTYFGIAKNTFDQSKIKIISNEFWQPMFDLVDKFAMSASREFFCGVLWSHQKEYSLYLKQMILKELMMGKMKIPNTRDRLLIPVTAYRHLSKNKAFLDMRTLSISKAAEVRYFMLQWINRQYDDSKNKFVMNLIKLHLEVDYYAQDRKPVIDGNNNAMIYGGYCCTHCQGRNLSTSKKIGFNPY